MRKVLLLKFIFFSFLTQGQNIGIGTNSPQAALDVSSTTNGFLPPRMTYAQRNAIQNPVSGLMVYCTDCDTSGQPQFYNGSRWCNMLGEVAKNPIVIPEILPSVSIGNQTWASKNLDVATYRNGDPIPQVTDQSQWVSLTTGAWCWYNNDSATYAATYGRLYNWYAVNDPRGLAPNGWHVPTEAEWNKLIKFIDPSSDTSCIRCYQSTTQGGALKSTLGWQSPNSGATNSSGFSALPACGRDFNGIFYGIGYYAYWWSANEKDSIFACGRGVYYDQVIWYSWDNGYKKSGYPVRVVKD